MTVPIPAINPDSRPDRWRMLTGNLDRTGLSAARIEAVNKAAPADGPQARRMGTGHAACLRSHCRALKAFPATDAPVALILENDAEWHSDLPKVVYCLDWWPDAHGVVSLQCHVERPWLGRPVGFAGFGHELRPIPERNFGTTGFLIDRRTAAVLAMQDTTALNYSGLKATEGLDAIVGGGRGSTGILAHAGLAVTPQGRPLGLFTMDAAFQEDPEEDSRRWVAGLRRARELSDACPDTRVISVCDREGDFWDLLACAVDEGNTLLVRASRSVRRSVRTSDGGTECLWGHVAACGPIAMTELTIPAASGPRARRERTARLGIRMSKGELAPPAWDSSAKPLH